MSEVDRLAARRDDLATAVANARQERDGIDRQIAAGTGRARLPVLDNIRIASPCTMGWQNMTGDDRTRYCGQCKKDVYNLTGMTRVEAEALIVAKHGELCVRYFQRHDGTIMLADCDLGANGRRRMKFLAAGVAALLAGGAIAAGILVGRDDSAQLGALSEVHPPRDEGGRHAPVPKVRPQVRPQVGDPRTTALPQLRPQSPLGEHVDGGIGRNIPPPDVQLARPRR